MKSTQNNEINQIPTQPESIQVLKDNAINEIHPKSEMCQYVHSFCVC